MTCYKVTVIGATPYLQQGSAVQSNGVQYPSWHCANSISFVTDTILGTDPNPYYAGMLGSFLVIDGVNTRNWGAPGSFFTADPGNSQCPSDCNTATLNSPYDCLNGTCVLASKYATPGLYKSLNDCQSVCANGGACASGKQCVDPTTFCPNGKVCIDQDEYSNIQGLISKINNEMC